MPADPALQTVNGLTLDLPLPPSVNELFANVPNKGRVKTKKYKDWIIEAGWELRRQKPHNFLRPVTVHIDVRLKGRCRDLDNMLKSALDLIGPTQHGIIRDDSSKILKGFSIQVSDHDDIEPGWMRLTIASTS